MVLKCWLVCNDGPLAFLAGERAGIACLAALLKGAELLVLMNVVLMLCLVVLFHHPAVECHWCSADIPLINYHILLTRNYSHSAVHHPVVNMNSMSPTGLVYVYFMIYHHHHDHDL